jgi:hypothetical protein
LPIPATLANHHHVAFGRATGGALGGLLLHFIVELALSDSVGFGERLVPLYVDLS